MAAQTVPVKLYLPAGGDVSGMTATEDGAEYAPTELCPECFAVVPQAKTAAHAEALHPVAPPSTTTAPAF
jgi:hypothetical protein